MKIGQTEAEKKIRQKRIQPDTLLFFISYGIFITMTLLRTTFFFKYVDRMAFKAILGICVVIIIIKEIAFNRDNRASITSMIIGACFTCFSIFVQVNQYLVFAATVIFIFAARAIPFRKIAVFSAILMGAFLFLVILSSQIGLIQDYILYESNGRIRHFLGFRYALYSSTILMNITMLVVYVRKKNIRWIEIIALTIVNVGLFLLTRSRLTFILALAALVIGTFLKIWPEFMVKKKKLKYILSVCFILFAMISLIASVKYDPENKTHVTINLALNNRLAYQKKAMDEYGLSIFGQDFDTYGGGLNAEGEKSYDTDLVEYFYIDNNYIVWFVRNGLIFFLLIIAACTAMTIRSIWYDKYGYLFLILVLMSISCMIQDTFLSIHYNTFIMSAGNLLLNNKAEESLE